MIRDFTLVEFWAIASGLWATLQLSAIAFVGGGLAGLGVALARTAPVRALRFAAGVFIDFFQGTPMLLQLFLVFYGLPVFGFKVNVWVAAADVARRRLPGRDLARRHPGRAARAVGSR